jgi:hypothetical protein
MPSRRTETNERWRRRILKGGLCPHCGKRPQRGFTECEERRVYKRISRAATHLVAWAAIRKLGPGHWEALDRTKEGAYAIEVANMVRPLWTRWHTFIYRYLVAHDDEA